MVRSRDVASDQDVFPLQYPNIPLFGGSLSFKLGNLFTDITIDRVPTSILMFEFAQTAAEGGFAGN